MSEDSYCRDIEAYLCRKNEGHLIRIAGPAFEQVSRWAEQGIPLKVAQAGIDRYFERYYRKGPRRRPVRIEFCEADVLDAFDDWRRAVGVAREEATPARSRVSLASHVERAIARLTTLRASSERALRFADTLEHVARELDGLQPQCRNARGQTRDALLAQLVALDTFMMTAVMSALDHETRSAALADAKEQLAAFRDRMTADAYSRSCDAAVTRYVREYYGLPTVTFE